MFPGSMRQLSLFNVGNFKYLHTSIRIHYLLIVKSTSTASEEEDSCGHVGVGSVAACGSECKRQHHSIPRLNGYIPEGFEGDVLRLDLLFSSESPVVI